MARKKPEGTDSRESVRHVTLENSRPLRTIFPDDAIWEDRHSTLPYVKDAIVRVRPPESATDDDIERVRKFCHENGAIRVFTLPRPRAEVLSGNSETKVAKAVGAREAVVSIIEESNSKDKDALRTLCESVMSKIGL